MLQEIRDNLSKAESQVKRLRKANTRFIYISLIASVLATLIAGVTAFTGPMIGQGPVSWKWTCGVVAIFTATATVFTGLQKQLTISERLSKANECVGKIKSIIISIESSPSDSDNKEFINEYRKVVELYTEYLV